MVSMNIEKIPTELLQKAFNLNNGSRKIFVALCQCNSPKSSEEVGALIGESRAYVNMRLNQLVELNLVEEVKVAHSRKKLFTVKK